MIGTIKCFVATLFKNNNDDNWLRPFKGKVSYSYLFFSLWDQGDVILTQFIEHTFSPCVQLIY